MKGIPSFIKTPQDLNNLFAMAQEDLVSKSALAEKVQALVEMQYQRVPILNLDGNTVTTRYFAEVRTGDITAEGATVTAVEHIEAPPDENAPSTDESVSYDKTIITLTAELPADCAMLAVYRENNLFALSGFDLQQVNYILGVLAQ